MALQLSNPTVHQVVPSSPGACLHPFLPPRLPTDWTFVPRPNKPQPEHWLPPKPPASELPLQDAAKGLTPPHLLPGLQDPEQTRQILHLDPCRELPEAQLTIECILCPRLLGPFPRAPRKSGRSEGEAEVMATLQRRPLKTKRQNGQLYRIGQNLL